MLNDIRVLEISAPETMMAGRILADFGADVVVVEPPGGAPGRRMEPFLDAVPGIERSLAWHALNRNKRAITLDLDSADGRELLTLLAGNFDAILETAAPVGAPLDNIDLPGTMVRCTINAFARTGPKSDYLATDLLVMASSGAPSMTGDSDRPPLFYSVPQSIMEAGSEAAIAVLAGIVARDRGAQGQRAELSARIAAMMSSMSMPTIIGSGNHEPRRAETTIAGVRVPAIFECADGYMLVTVPAFGPAFGPMTQRLAKWAADEGHMSREIADVNWITFPQDLARKTSTPDHLRALVEGVSSLCRGKTKSELGAAARKLGLLAAPVMDMRDVAESPQYRERGLWNSVQITPDGREIDVPARFAQFSNFSIETKRPAPSLSQHTAQILCDCADVSPLELQALFVHGVI
ncbi:MAG TPA: CoA transferase [Candidatus Binataceae bacterium]|nr:CoA transferase [Candidatus Binataceae bacterium]